LMPALERVKENCGAMPERIIADNCTGSAES
jgi:hypothetical protein